MTKIECNVDCKDSSINCLNDCIDYLDDVNNIFYNISYSSGFRYSGTLSNIKSSIRNRREDIRDYKDDLNYKIEEIERNEMELLSIINRIEDIQIKSFDFEVIWR